MQQVNLRNIDLNLLVVLQTLLAERHVTRAAERLNMSQPAVSHALDRLRHVFDDRLLIRVGQRMEHTARGQELAHQLGPALSTVKHLFEPRLFDPTTAAGTVVIRASEGVTSILLDPLLQMQAIAPLLAFEISGDFTDIHGRLKAGSVDLYIDADTRPPASDLRVERLFRNNLLCVARKGSVEGGAMTVEQFEARGHVVIPGGTSSYVATQLFTMGIRQTVRMSVPGYLAASNIVARSDCIMTIPAILARNACAIFPLESFDPPFDVRGIPLSIFWHSINDSDPVHTWVREGFIAHLSDPPSLA